MVDINKLKLTALQNEIFRLFCMKAGDSLNQRETARILNVSAAGVSKALKLLEEERLIKVKKDKSMNLTLIELNREDHKVIQFKRVENLRRISGSGVIEFLEEKFPGSTLILFGSYSYGEDTVKSDIDLAIIGANQKEVNLEKFERLFEKEIRINFYKNWKEIHKNLKNNLFNGIVLFGGIEL